LIDKKIIVTILLQVIFSIMILQIYWTTFVILNIFIIFFDFKKNIISNYALFFLFILSFFNIFYKDLNLYQIYYLIFFLIFFIFLYTKSKIWAGDLKYILILWLFIDSNFMILLGNIWIITLIFLFIDFLTWLFKKSNRIYFKKKISEIGFFFQHKKLIIFKHIVFFWFFFLISFISSLKVINIFPQYIKSNETFFLIYFLIFSLIFYLIRHIFINKLKLNIWKNFFVFLFFFIFNLLYFYDKSFILENINYLKTSFFILIFVKSINIFYSFFWISSIFINSKDLRVWDYIFDEKKKITDKQVSKDELKNIKKMLNEKEILIHKTFPFAAFIFLWFLITKIADSYFISFIKFFIYG